MKQIFTFLSAILFLIQVSARGITPFSAWDDAESMQAQFHSYTNEFLFNTLNNTFANMSRSLDLRAQTTISNGAQEIKTKSKLIVDEYESLKNSPKVATTNIKQCFDDYEDRIINIEAEILDDLFDCVNNVSNELVDYISSEAIKIIQTYYSILFSGEKRLLACEPSDNNCLNSFSFSIRDIIEHLGTSINSDSFIVWQSLQSNLNAISACATQHVNVVEEKGKQLLEKVRICSNDKLKLYS